MKRSVSAVLALALSGCVQLGLGGDTGSAAGSGSTSGGGDGATPTAYAVSGVLTRNTCGNAVGASDTFQNTANVTIDGEAFTFAAGGLVAQGSYDDADREFDATAESPVDLAAMTGLQGTGCQLSRVDLVSGDFDGEDAAGFDGTLEIRYVPNDPALCYELLVATWDATFSAIPCEVEYDISGTKVE